jgi:hypothetical protein
MAYLVRALCRTVLSGYTSAMEPVSTVGPLLKLLHWLLGRSTKKQEVKVEAAAAFRGVVLHELAGLYPHCTQWPSINPLMHRLEAVFPALQTAVATYRPYVSDKAAYDQAWLWYRSATKREVDVQCYLHYMTGTSTTNNAHGGQTTIHEDGQANFKRNVDRLLSFATEV